jgi:TRAP-type C4-dicarboxylate transport system substrate-binding protein
VVHALQPWINQVKEATQGRVDIQVAYSQTLVKGPATWDAVKNGVVDIGWCLHGYWPDLTPLANVITLPALPFKLAEKGSEVLWKIYEEYPVIQQEFQENHILILYTSSPYLLITNKKPVKTLEDLQGMRIRTIGGPPAVQIEALGAIPASVPMPQCYQALQDGRIDGMGVTWTAIQGFKLYEVAKFYTEVPFPAVYFSLAINKATWNRLPVDIQEAIMSVSGLEGSKFWGRHFFDTAKEGVYQRVRESGAEINLYTLTEDEWDRWLEIGGKHIWLDWAMKMKQQGHSEASQILKSVLKYSEQ